MGNDDRQRQNLIAAVAVIVLVVLGIWLLIAFKKSTDMLDCIAAHHRDCTPIDTGQ